MIMILHEGGHALWTLIQRRTLFLFYVHPFSFSGYIRDDVDWTIVWPHAFGPAMGILVPLLIFIPLWKHRSISNLPLVMLFPYGAIGQGLYILSLSGDIRNIMQITGLPGTVFAVLGSLIFSSGIFFLISLFPLLGVAPEDKRSLLVIPSALSMYCIFGMLVAYLCLPGSPVDVQYQLGGEILTAAKTLTIIYPLLGVLLASLHITLYRWIYRKLPAGLRTETISLTWKDLRIPAVLAAISVILGLIIIT